MARRSLLLLVLTLLLGTTAWAQDALDGAVSETLAGARAQLGDADYARFAEAVDYAREAHRGQARDGGRPFLLHPLRVARSILTQPGHVSADALIAAALHDVVEDTPRTLEQLRARFGARVASLVDALSLPPVELDGQKQARDRAYYERFARAPRDAQVVKFHDRLDNVRDMAGWGPEGKLGYLASTRATVIASLRGRSPDLAQALEAEVRTLSARVEAELVAVGDRLAAYRRADGTLRWKPLLRAGALREGAGLAHFTLALFLKELALVVRTGDRLRMEEFFDGLASTDFYVHYGLFAAGARAGEVAYARYLQRLVKPRFVSGLLRTNVALGAGLALPQLVAGEFEAEAFVITLGSLGLSSAAVKAGVQGLSALPGASARSGLARLGLRVGRLASAAGWVVTVAETAVVLLLADAIEARVGAWRDERAARGALADAGLEFFAAVQQPGLGSAQLAAALEAYASAWEAWRVWLYQPLRLEEARLQGRLDRLARDAKLLADQREAALEQRDAFPALRARLEAYAAGRAREGDVALEADLEAALAAYQRACDALLDGVQRDVPRESPYLQGAPLAAAREDAAQGPFQRLEAGRALARLRAALADASPTRPGSYRDQVGALEAARGLLAGQPGLQAQLDACLAQRAAESVLDHELLGLSGALR